jgi:thiamine pyrophosphate-dependent acetolactate synthase large subunit-like protein
MSRRLADLLVETLQAAGVKTCYGIVDDTLNRIAHATDRSEIDWVHVQDVASAKAETVSGPDAAISGTYLTKIINKDALFAADDGTAAVWMLRHIDTGGKRRTFARLAPRNDGEGDGTVQPCCM